MFDLGRAHDSGSDGYKKDELEAFKWYLRAAEAGMPRAMGEVAERYREGIGVRRDWDASLVWADKGAEKGDAQSLYLASILPFQDVDVDSKSEERMLVQNSAKKVARLTQAAEGGSVDAMIRLGEMLREGVWYTIEGKRKAATVADTESAKRWLETASDKGSAIATLGLARWYQKGGDGLKADELLAAKYWDRVESTATPDGMYVIGRELHHPALPFEKDPPKLWRDQVLTKQQACSKSRQWLERAAGQGHAEAALDLGSLLSSTQCGFKSEVEAFKYFHQSAEAGLIDGQKVVSFAYYTGLGVAKDYSRAYSWALRAATHPTAARSSMSGAQSNIALHLAYGIGVEKDSVLAYAWANVSAAAGEKEAKDLVASLDRVLEANLVREAQQISSTWKLGDDMKRLRPSSASNSGTSASAASSGAALKLAGAGTGFFISGNGTLVTNYHVAGKCAEVRLPALAKKAAVLAADAANDLTALRVDGVPGASARLADPSKVKQGQEIVAFGFPLEGYLPSAGNITTGLISALSGPGNNTSLIQISTPVQQGSSGGPVMNLKGEVVGVVVGKADVIRIAKETGDVLQNVNFAVSTATLQAFLDANRLEYKKSSYFSTAKKPDALVDEARTFTAKVECWR